MTTSVFLEKLHAVDSLPTPPQIAMEIIEICQDPEKGVGDLSRVLALDSAMASRVLRIANSPTYRRGRDIKTIDQAVATLGMKSVSIVALGFSLKGALPGWKHESGISDVHLWQHSVATAVASRQIARLISFAEPELAFLCGLLSRMGQQVFYMVSPEEYGKVLQAANGELPTVEQEREILNLHHNVAGAMLAKKWNLPSVVCEVISGWSGDSTSDDELVRTCIAIVQAADAVAQLLFGKDKAAGLGRLHDIGQSDLQITAGEIDRMFVACELEVRDTLTVFAVEPTSEIDCEGILELARHQLVQVSLGLAADLNVAKDNAESLKEVNSSLQKAATTDPLTGLPNRMALDSELDSLCQIRAKSQPRPYSIIMVDVDHFKNFNDTYGHVVGDTVLKAIGETLSEVARSTDFVARYGGEEFTVVLTNVGKNLASSVAERYRSAVEAKSIDVGGKSLSVTASLGVASSDEFDQVISSAEILKAADMALYAAKDGGRNRVATLADVKATAE